MDVQGLFDVGKASEGVFSFKGDSSSPSSPAKDRSNATAVDELAEAASRSGFQVTSAQESKDLGGRKSPAKVTIQGQSQDMVEGWIEEAGIKDQVASVPLSNGQVAIVPQDFVKDPHDFDIDSSNKQMQDAGKLAQEYAHEHGTSRPQLSNLSSDEGLESPAVQDSPSQDYSQSL